MKKISILVLVLLFLTSCSLFEKEIVDSWNEDNGNTQNVELSNEGQVKENKAQNNNENKIVAEPINNNKEKETNKEASEKPMQENTDVLVETLGKDIENLFGDIEADVQ